MAVFESLNHTTDKAVDSAEKYIKTSQSYLRLKVFQQITVSLSLVVKLAVIGGLTMFAIVFIAVSGALAIGEALHNLSAGYLIVGVCFLLLAYVAYHLRTHIEKKIIAIVSDKFFD